MSDEAEPITVAADPEAETFNDFSGADFTFREAGGRSVMVRFDAKMLARTALLFAEVHQQLMIGSASATGHGEISSLRVERARAHVPIGSDHVHAEFRVFSGLQYFFRLSIEQTHQLGEELARAYEAAKKNTKPKH